MEKVNVLEKIYTILKKFFIASILVLIVTLMGFKPIFITGVSMENTIFSGEVFYSTPCFSEIDYNDIVVIQSDVLHMQIIKRVIGLPGDIIEFRNNIFYLNGYPVKEDYLKEPMITSDIILHLGENEYFVCGDNRNNSLDSRSELIGPIRKNEIISIIRGTFN